MPVTVLRCESDHRDLSFFPPLSPQQRAWPQVLSGQQLPSAMRRRWKEGGIIYCASAHPQLLSYNPPHINSLALEHPPLEGP